MRSLSSPTKHPGLLLLPSIILLAACSGAPEGTDQSGDALDRPTGYQLPWAVGRAHAVGQGDGGALPGGGHSDHVEQLCNGAGQCGQLMIHAIDFEMDLGEKVLAAKDGTVVFQYAGTRPGDPCFDGDGNTGRCAGRENLVVLRHADGLETQYLHFSRVDVALGQHVTAGQLLGLAGATGQASGPHLHFQVQRPCGAPMCQSVRTNFEDAGMPGPPGTWILHSYEGGARCWSDGLDRFVENACVQKPGDASQWNVCADGQWRSVDVASGATCPAGSPVYGYCQTESGDWLPARSCHAFPRGDGGYDWKQCAQWAQWLGGVADYEGAPVGGPMGECAGM